MREGSELSSYYFQPTTILMVSLEIQDPKELFLQKNPWLMIYHLCVVVWVSCANNNYKTSNKYKIAHRHARTFEMHT